MNFDAFFEEIERHKVDISFDNRIGGNPVLLSNEALFHLPFLATIILLIGKGRQKTKSSEIGQIVGECLERSLTGFKGSSQHLGWSANLRIRTVKALTFLETAKLIVVDKRDNAIKATEFGRKVIDKALTEDTDLSFALKTIERSYRNIRSERQIEMDLS